MAEDVAIGELWRAAQAARAAGDSVGACRELDGLLSRAPAHVAALRARASLAPETERATWTERLADAATVESLDIALALRDGPMAARAEALARRAIAERPQLARGHRMLMDLLRRQGRLDEAAAAAAAAPDTPETRATRAALLGTPGTSDVVEETPPIRFVVRDGFLTMARHAEALAFALAGGDTLETAMVGGDDSEWKVDPEARRARAGYELAAVRDWFLPLVEAELETALPGLGLAPFERGETELQLTAYNDGEYYRTHADRDDRGLTGRWVTFVYYFNHAPRAFDGGELILFDGDAARGTMRSDAFTTILPVDNRLVIFPSAAQHEVRTVRCRSGAYVDSRFTLNGWFQRA